MRNIVAWQRFNETAQDWIDTPADDVERYKSLGVKVRPLFADTLDADIGMTERFHSQSAYSCDLARIIEALCNGSELREPETGARHHYNMAVAYRTNNAVPANIARALRLCKRLMDNMNEFDGTCTDSETYDAAWIAINFAIKELRDA